MKLTDQDILLASLLGSQVDIPRWEAVENELSKHVMPPVPILPFKRKEEIGTAEPPQETLRWQADKPLPADQQFFPLWFELDGRRWLFPYEPMVNIEGKHTIVKRNVAKAGRHSGTIKERWNQSDYQITITGVLIGSVMTGDVSQTYPREDFEKLRDFLTSGRRIRVYCEPLQLLGIDHIVVESFSFPFTKGENVQAYQIKALSDMDYQLLIDETDV